MATSMELKANDAWCNVLAESQEKLYPDVISNTHPMVLT